LILFLLFHSACLPGLVWPRFTWLERSARAHNNNNNNNNHSSSSRSSNEQEERVCLQLLLLLLVFFFFFVVQQQKQQEETQLTVDERTDERRDGECLLLLHRHSVDSSVLCRIDTAGRDGQLFALIANYFIQIQNCSNFAPLMPKMASHLILNFKLKIKTS